MATKEDKEKKKKGKKKGKIDRKVDWFADFFGLGKNLKIARDKKHANQSEARKELERQQGASLKIKKKKKET